MTREEEIKQNAEAYADTKAETVANFQRNPIVEDFINGAQWADEHPKNPWISVEERLPEDNKTVLVWFGGYYTVAVIRDNEWWDCTGYQTGGGWSALDKIPDIACGYITHWMPIPKLPNNN